MTFHRKIGFRLVSVYSILVLAGLVAFALFNYYRLSRRMLRVVDRQFSEEEYELIAPARSNPDRLADAVREVDGENSFFRRPSLFFYVADEEGKEIARSASVTHGGMLASPEGFREALKHGKYIETVKLPYKYRIRCCSFRIDGPDGKKYVAQVGFLLQHYDKTLDNFTENMCIAVPGYGLVVVLLGWLLVRRSFQPVRQIRRAAERISAANLRERVPETNRNDEIDKLAKTFNRMINRIEMAFDRQKQFSADASHELRTPITAMQNQIELVLECDREKEQYVAVLNNVLEELRTLKKIADNLLILARAEIPQDEVERRVDVVAVLRDLCETADLLAREKKMTLTTDLPPELHAAADTESLKSVVVNIIDNAIRYTREGGHIHVGAVAEDDKVKIFVRDDGPGITKEDLPHIFERFYRGAAAHQGPSDGSGLGLSICNVLVKRMGGKIEVESSPGQGSTFTIVLPRAEQDSGKVGTKSG